MASIIDVPAWVDIDVAEMPLSGYWRWTCPVCPEPGSYAEMRPADNEPWDLNFNALRLRTEARRFLKVLAVKHMDSSHTRHA